MHPCGYLIFTTDVMPVPLSCLFFLACQIVPQLLSGLEKSRFKRHLDNLLIIMAAAAESQLPLAVAAAEESLSLLTSRIGPNVLRGRMENHLDSRVTRTLTRFLPPA